MSSETTPAQPGWKNPYGPQLQGALPSDAIRAASEAAARQEREADQPRRAGLAETLKEQMHRKLLGDDRYQALAAAQAQESGVPLPTEEQLTQDSAQPASAALNPQLVARLMGASGIPADEMLQRREQHHYERKAERDAAKTPLDQRHLMRLAKARGGSLSPTRAMLEAALARGEFPGDDQRDAYFGTAPQRILADAQARVGEAQAAAEAAQHSSEAMKWRGLSAGYEQSMGGLAAREGPFDQRAADALTEKYVADMGGGSQPAPEPAADSIESDFGIIDGLLDDLPPVYREAWVALLETAVDSNDATKVVEFLERLPGIDEDLVERVIRTVNAEATLDKPGGPNLLDRAARALYVPPREPEGPPGDYQTTFGNPAPTQRPIAGAQQSSLRFRRSGNAL